MIGHAMTVDTLNDLLRRLEPDDIVIPNAVANLKIIRGGKYIGYIDFREGGQEVVLFENGGEP